jgi:hypothetical protein
MHDTLEFVSGEEFRIEIEARPHNDIPAGPEGNPFENSVLKDVLPGPARLEVAFRLQRER